MFVFRVLLGNVGAAGGLPPCGGLQQIAKDCKLFWTGVLIGRWAGPVKS